MAKVVLFLTNLDNFQKFQIYGTLPGSFTELLVAIIFLYLLDGGTSSGESESSLSSDTLTVSSSFSWWPGLWCKWRLQWFEFLSRNCSLHKSNLWRPLIILKIVFYGFMFMDFDVPWLIQPNTSTLWEKRRHSLTQPTQLVDLSQTHRPLSQVPLRTRVVQSAGRWEALPRQFSLDMSLQAVLSTFSHELDSF